MKHAVPALLLLPALHVQAQAQADNCEPIRLQIEGRFRAGGVANPVLVVLPAGGAGAGRVVGSCGNGSRQIVLQATGAAATVATALSPAPAATSARATGHATGPATVPATGSATGPATAPDKIPTECKDGSIVIGPRCDDPRAVRMTSAEIAAAADAPAPQPAATPAAKPASQ
jgi:hypothetical protein